MEITLVDRVPPEAGLVYPATKDQAVSLLRHHYGIDQVTCIEAKMVAGYLRARSDMMGSTESAPLVGVVVTDATVVDEDDLVIAISTSRQTRTKVVFIGQVTGARLMANLYTLKRNY